MNEDECLKLMKAPGDVRKGKHSKCVIQILVTSSCNLACSNCTQASQIKRPHWAMTPRNNFNTACESLKGYQHVVGCFGGNPTTSKHFPEYWPKSSPSTSPNNNADSGVNDPLGPRQTSAEKYSTPESQTSTCTEARKPTTNSNETGPNQTPSDSTTQDTRPSSSAMTDLNIPEPETLGNSSQNAPSTSNGQQPSASSADNYAHSSAKSHSHKPSSTNTTPDTLTPVSQQLPDGGKSQCPTSQNKSDNTANDAQYHSTDTDNSHKTKTTQLSLAYTGPQPKRGTLNIVRETNRTPRRTQSNVSLTTERTQKHERITRMVRA